MNLFRELCLASTSLQEGEWISHSTHPLDEFRWYFSRECEVLNVEDDHVTVRDNDQVYRLSKTSLEDDPEFQVLGRKNGLIRTILTGKKYVHD